MKQIIAGGGGFVGKEIAKVFPFADIYDPIKGHTYIAPYYDCCHVAVPTPSKEDGSCDTLFVEDVITKINADLYIIRSTIPIGFTDELEAKYGKNIVFSPEYVASSSPYPAPLADIHKRDFHIFGGRPENTKKARKLYEKSYPPTCKFLEVTAKTAEIIKLAENTYIANKVTFANELYEICQQFMVDYDQVREGVFILDPRMTPWFTYVREGLRGFSSSHCLPKDINNLIRSCEKIKYDPLFIKEILKNNERWKKNSLK